MGEAAGGARRLGKLLVFRGASQAVGPVPALLGCRCLFSHRSPLLDQEEVLGPPELTSFFLFPLSGSQHTAFYFWSQS